MVLGVHSRFEVRDESISQRHLCSWLSIANRCEMAHRDGQ
jgi:hypothetical protein